MRRRAPDATSYILEFLLPDGRDCGHWRILTRKQRKKDYTETLPARVTDEHQTDVRSRRRRGGNWKVCGGVYRPLKKPNQVVTQWDSSHARRGAADAATLAKLPELVRET